MAFSDVGVAWNKKRKIVDIRMLGSLIVSHRLSNCIFRKLISPLVSSGSADSAGCKRLILLLHGDQSSSSTRPTTPEVIRGRKAVTPNTNLQTC
jgi:hypothetical protein